MNQNPGTPADESPSDANDRPVLRVVRGDPSPQELAALLAVVSARNAAARNAGRATGRPRSEWGHPARRNLAPPRVGPDQWRRSALP